MSSRITAVELDNFAEAALEILVERDQRAMSMHEVANQAWSPDQQLPEMATAPSLDANLRVRKVLEEDHKKVVVPVAMSYFRKIRSRVFTENEIAGCLPRRGHQQYGLLFIDEESPARDLQVWQTWVRREMNSSATRSENARASVHNALNSSLISELESQKLLALEAGTAEGAA